MARCGTRPSPRQPSTDSPRCTAPPPTSASPATASAAGLGWYARALGLAANHVTAAEVVIGDGTIVRTDAEHDPELFWALRGGGGNFGVVTALEFSLFDIATAYAGMMIFDISRAEQVLRRWAAWAVDGTRAGHHLVPGAAPAAAAGAAALPQRTLGGRDRRGRAGLRRPGRPDPGRPPGPEAGDGHLPADAGPGAHPAAHGSRRARRSGPAASAMLRELPDAGIDAFLAAVADRSTTSLMMAELRQLGGALARPRPGGGAVSHFDGQFLAFAGGMVMGPETALQVGADAAAFTGALAPWTGGRTYLNFAEDAVDPRQAYDAATWRQLVGDPLGGRPERASSSPTTRCRGSTRTVAPPADHPEHLQVRGPAWPTASARITRAGAEVRRGAQP